MQVLNGAKKLKERSKAAQKKGAKRQNVAGTAVDHTYVRKKKRACCKIMNVINITLKVRIGFSIVMEQLLLDSSAG